MIRQVRIQFLAAAEDDPMMRNQRNSRREFLGLAGAAIRE
jgi:hypothetical protein